MRAEAVGECVAADGQARITAGDVGQAQVPAKGIGRNREGEILPSAGGLAGDAAGAAVKDDRRQTQRVDADGIGGIGITPRVRMSLNTKRVIGDRGRSEVDERVMRPGITMPICEGNCICGCRQVTVGAQSHAGIRHAIIQMHFQTQRAGRNGEAVILEVSALRRIVGGEVGDPGRVHSAELVGGDRAVAVKRVAGAVRARVAVIRIRVHALTYHGYVVSAVGDGGFVGRGARQLGEDLVAVPLQLAATRDLRWRGATGNDVGQIILLDNHCGFAVGGDQFQFPTGLARRHLHLVIDGLARRDIGAADGADERQVINGNGLVSANAPTEQGITHQPRRGGRGRIHTGIVASGFKRIVSAHRENGAVAVGSIRIIIPTCPVVTSRPLVAARPGGEGPGIVPAIVLIDTGVESIRGQIAADDQLRSANGVRQPDVPAEGVAGNIELVEAPDIVGMTGDVDDPAIEGDRAGCQGAHQNSISGIGVAARVSVRLHREGIGAGLRCGDVDDRVALPLIALAQVTTIAGNALHQQPVGAQIHARIGRAIVQSHFHREHAGCDRELVFLHFAAKQGVRQRDVRPGGNQVAHLIGGRDAVAGEHIAGSVRANVAIVVVRIHALADHREVVGASGNVGLHGGVRQQQIEFVAELLQFAPAADHCGSAASADNIGQVIFLNQQQGFTVGDGQPEFPTRRVARNLHAIVGRFARNQRTIGHHATCEGKVGDGYGHAIGCDAAAGQSIAHRRESAAVDHAYIVGARLEGIAHAHRKQLAVVNRSAGTVVVITRPVIAGAPAITARPGG